MVTIFNPYQRIKEIDAELEPLELREKAFMNKGFKRKPFELEKIEQTIFFLVIEKNHIEKTINYFEKIKKDLGEEKKWNVK